MTGDATRLDRVKVVERLYAALDADDVDGMLGLLTPDVVVHYPAAGLLPYGGEWRGHEAVGQFLGAHDQAEEILAFKTEQATADGDRVLVVGVFKGRSRSTDRAWQTSFVHVFRVGAGGIESWEAFFDSAAAVEAHRS